MTNRTTPVGTVDKELVESLRLSSEMLADGHQRNLTELWHSEVVKDAARECAAAATLIEQLHNRVERLNRALDLMPDEIEAFRIIRSAEGKTYADKARAIAARIEGIRFAALTGENNG